MSQYLPTEAQGPKEGRAWAPRDILVMMFRRRWVILGVSLPIIAFAIYGTLSTVDSFFAESQVLLESRNPEDPTFRNLGVDYTLIMSTAAQVASSIPVAEKAALALVDSLPALHVKAPSLVHIETLDDLRSALLKGVSCNQVGESNILSIGFSSRSPEFALMAAGAMTQAYIAYSAESKHNPQALDYYTEQINVVLGDVETLLAARAAVYENGGLAAFKQNSVEGINHMRQMEYLYLKTKSDRMVIEDRISEIKQKIRENPDYAPTVRGTNNLSMADALSNFNEAKLQLAELRLSYNDSSVFVTRHLEYMEGVRKIFHDERDNFIANLEVELAETRKQEQEEYLAVEGYRKAILEFPEMESRINNIDIQLESLRDLLETLEMKRGEIRVKSESDLRISSIVPLNRPSIGTAIGGGKKFIYLVLASIIGVTLGLVVALFIDVNDHRIYDRRQAQEFLNLPVLGAISQVEASARKP